MKTFAYAVTGVEEGTAESARREIENAGYRVTHWFADAAATGLARRTEAQQFAAMMHRMQEGETLVVTRLHHLGHDAEDVQVTIQALERRSVGLIVLELGESNLLSDAGSLMLKMLNAIVEMEGNRRMAGKSPDAEPGRPRAKRGGRATTLSRELRARMITDYSQGVGVSELARRYSVSRMRIQEVVAPKRKDDEPLPIAWGD
jgi:DNA invertase Pin-like site-specific DNA recombinase